jgi:chemotaxis protein MotB
MNTLRMLALVTLLTLAAVLAGGCNKELEMKNRSLMKRVDDLEGEKKQLETDNERLRSRLAAEEAATQAAELQVAELTADNRELRDVVAKLQATIRDISDIPRGGPIPENLKLALREFAARYPQVVTFDEESGMIKFASDLTFPKGSADVQPRAKEILGMLARILQTEDGNEFGVYVAGHTDNIPIGKPSTREKHPTNWHLSAHRAIGVQDVLVDQGIPPERIAVMGFGEYHPIEPNAPNKKGNPANRRVEVWLSPMGQFLTRPAMTPGTPTAEETTEEIILPGS